MADNMADLSTLPVELSNYIHDRVSNCHAFVRMIKFLKSDLAKHHEVCCTIDQLQSKEAAIYDNVTVVYDPRIDYHRLGNGLKHFCLAHPKRLSHFTMKEINVLLENSVFSPTTEKVFTMLDHDNYLSYSGKSNVMFHLLAKTNIDTDDENFGLFYGFHGWPRLFTDRASTCLIARECLLDVCFINATVTFVVDVAHFTLNYPTPRLLFTEIKNKFPKHAKRFCGLQLIAESTYQVKFM